MSGMYEKEKIDKAHRSDFRSARAADNSYTAGELDKICRTDLILVLVVLSRQEIVSRLQASVCRTSDLFRVE